MDGLEAVELKLSEVLEDNNNFRFDSEFFRRDAVFATNQIKSIKHSKLEDLVSDGYRVVYENTEIIDISKEDENNFCRFLQASDLQTPQILLDRIGYVSNADWERYPKGRIKTGELLIEVKGKCEKIAIVHAGFPEKTLVSGSLFKLTVNDNISREFLLIYLISKYGTALKDRLKTNLLISYINKPDLYNILVPIFSNDFQKYIETLVKSAHQKLEESKKLYREAEEILLEELGLNDFTPSNECVAVKSFSESFGMSGRLDAEYYQLKYDDIIGRIKSYQGGYKKLGTITTLKKSIEPGSDAYGDEGVQFLRVADLFKHELKEPEIRLSENLFDAEKLDELKPKKEEVLLSKDGSVGIAYAVREDTNFIPSGAIVRLQQITEILPDVLALILNSQVVQLQAERDAGGSILQHWKPSEINEVLVPLLDGTVQKIIAEKISESFTLRTESKRLLEEAKKEVELAIERGEADGG